VVLRAIKWVQCGAAVPDILRKAESVMTSLMGTYYHNIDVKGRMNFPTKLREILGISFYITKSID